MIETALVKLFIARVPIVLPNVRAFERTIIDRVVDIHGKKVRLRSGIPGQSDVWALVKGGRHIEIEAKAIHGRMGDDQKRWKAFCDAGWCEHMIVYERETEFPHETVERWCQELRAVVERS